jgi:XTP/dITP diphosphohydrolase
VTNALLIATTNPGKLREIRAVLRDLAVQLKSLNDVASVPEPEETGRTFAENAALKARYYARVFNQPAVGEDSGLEIAALGGRPGVHSARYPGATYPDKFVNLYRELAPYPRPWNARYVSALAFIDPAAYTGDVLFECSGVVEGEIAPAPRGTNGFGYDPIFFYPPYGATFGEMDDERKLAVAHRGRAFRQFALWLARRLASQDEE